VTPRPLLVGEAPNRTGDARRPLDGRVGARLAGFAGLDVAAYRRRFARVNVLGAWPGASGGKGAAFYHDVAAREATRLRRRFRGRRTVVLLGQRVARAFGVRPDYFVERRVAGARVFVVPHPSGIVRWYNDPANVARMRRFMRAVALEAERGR